MRTHMLSARFHLGWEDHSPHARNRYQFSCVLRQGPALQSSTIRSFLRDLRRILLPCLRFGRTKKGFRGFRRSPSVSGCSVSCRKPVMLRVMTWRSTLLPFLIRLVKGGPIILRVIFVGSGRSIARTGRQFVVRARVSRTLAV